MPCSVFSLQDTVRFRGVIDESGEVSALLRFEDDIRQVCTSLHVSPCKVAPQPSLSLANLTSVRSSLSDSLSSILTNDLTSPYCSHLEDAVSMYGRWPQLDMCGAEIVKFRGNKRHEARNSPFAVFTISLSQKMLLQLSLITSRTLSMPRLLLSTRT